MCLSEPWNTHRLLFVTEIKGSRTGLSDTSLSLGGGSPRSWILTRTMCLTSAREAGNERKTCSHRQTCSCASILTVADPELLRIDRTIGGVLPHAQAAHCPPVMQSSLTRTAASNQGFDKPLRFSTPQIPCMDMPTQRSGSLWDTER